MIKFDFYISAMSVSDLHGGGLTLHRILEDDLGRIDYFFHVNRFAIDIPAAPQFLDRTVNIPTLWDSNSMRKIIGHTLSTKIARTPVMIKRHAKYAAKIINDKFEKGRELTILVCPQGANSVMVLHELKKLREINYITWIMDDHLLRYIHGDWQYPKYVEQIFAAHLRNAQHVFVISPALQQFYKTKFGVESTVLFGSSDLPENSSTHIVKTTGALKIGYFGAVASWQHDALLAFKRAISKTGTELHIYSGVQKFPKDLKSNQVHFKGRISPDNVQATILKYDAVLLPISFGNELRNMSQFNIATKMSEYLACGVPVLVIGPSYAAMVDYLSKHKAAVVITSTTKENIRQGIASLYNKPLVTEILANAQTLVQTEVGSIPMRKRWLDVVNA